MNSDERVIVCACCSDVLAVYEEGDRVPATPHRCPGPLIDFSELNEMLDEMRATRKPD